MVKTWQKFFESLRRINPTHIDCNNFSARRDGLPQTPFAIGTTIYRNYFLERASSFEPFLDILGSIPGHVVCL
jgi:hypothetical protein